MSKANTGSSEFFYCHSPSLHRFLQTEGQRYICVGLNENTLRKFWQYRRSDDLHRLLDEWSSNKPIK